MPKNLYLRNAENTVISCLMQDEDGSKVLISIDSPGENQSDSIAATAIMIITDQDKIEIAIKLLVPMEFPSLFGLSITACAFLFQKIKEQIEEDAKPEPTANG
jgi:hypothetical protein